MISMKEGDCLSRVSKIYIHFHISGNLENPCINTCAYKFSRRVAYIFLYYSNINSIRDGRHKYGRVLSRLGCKHGKLIILSLWISADKCHLHGFSENTDIPCIIYMPGVVMCFSTSLITEEEP